MSAAGRKHCVVAYALRDEQFTWKVELSADATVAEALTAARLIAQRDDIPWDSADVGIYGIGCRRTDVPLDGDRIEIYRPLAADPRERRRARVQSERRATRNPKR